MNNLEKYGTDDAWDIEQYQKAEEILKQYSDKKIESINDLDGIIANVMGSHGPDGHTDGSQIIALVCWRLLKNE